MGKILRYIAIIAMIILLGIDFAGLWKYKLSGKRYILEAPVSDSAAGDTEDTAGNTEQNVEYEEITGSTMSDSEGLFIKNIEVDGAKYRIKGLVYEQYEISKEDYTALRNGKGVEILGHVYTKKQIKSNNLILKSGDAEAKECYVKYDTTLKKYILSSLKTETPVYKSTEMYATISVAKGTEFVVQNGTKTEKKKIEDVMEKHQDLKEPEGETESINISKLIFNKNGICTQIIEQCN